MTHPDYDLCIIGGGINGAGIARDAVGRGLSVLLVEANDLAGATSSSSTKLIHGGLRYLEHYEFRLVREALAEREVLLGLAPHIIWPLEFILPHEPHLRPAWMIRTGLFLYDHLARHKKLPGSHGVSFRTHPAHDHLQQKYNKGFSYADCWVDDARLVVLNAMDAAARGATVLTKTACIQAAQGGGLWQLTLRDLRSGREKRASAAMLINAAGPWAHSFLDHTGLSGPETPKIRLVKGSHIIVPRLHPLPQAFILQQPDRRIVFAIPYEHDFTLVGTTDESYEGDPATPSISTDETAYLCDAINRSFQKNITPGDVVWSYSGVRPLLDDGDDNPSAVTRDYKLILDRSHGPPILSVFGGKITTYRKLAEHALDGLCGGQRWTSTAPLPGGDIPQGDFPAFLEDQKRRYASFPPELIERWARLYGTCMDKFIEGAKTINDLGHHMGAGLFEAEIYYMVRSEWARTPEDVLWRRTKLGLRADESTYETLDRYMPRIVREVTGT